MPISGTSPWTIGTATGTPAGGAVFVSSEPGLAPAGEDLRSEVRFFTRLGGVSAPPYDSLNVSKKVGDDPAAVEENLSLIRGAMGGKPSAWVRQVAGEEVLRVSRAGLAGEGDALLTEEEDLALAVAVADCAPVALVAERGVGMVHSGWRGTLAGISGKAAREMGSAGVEAYLGPGIRGCCYEVSGELAARFADRFGPGVVSGRYLSLPDAIRTDLAEAGVEAVHDLGLCTGCRPDLFYSHRKEGPHTGRNLAVVAKTGGADGTP